MTTPELPPDPLAPLDADEESPRIQRDEPARGGPNRSGAKPGPDRQARPVADEPIGESVANAVRMGYDVVAENIRQGRIAAERFRQGEYNIRDVPNDVEVLAKRMIDLARDLSTTTFDVVERLLTDKRAADLRPKPPPFRPNPAAAPGPPPEGAGSALIRVTCRFDPPDRAVVRSALISRPLEPTLPEVHIVLDALNPTVAGPKPIQEVAFSADSSGNGLVVSIVISPAQAAGVYSGLIYSTHHDWPLGVLSVEVVP